MLVYCTKTPHGETDLLTYSDMNVYVLNLCRYQSRNTSIDRYLST